MGLPSDAQESPGSLLAMLGQSGFVSMHRPKDVILLRSCSVKTTLMASGGPPESHPVMFRDPCGIGHSMEGIHLMPYAVSPAFHFYLFCLGPDLMMLRMLFPGYASGFCLWCLGNHVISIV